MTTRCTFCQLMKTGEARWVAVEEDAVAFRPLPETELAPGHTLVVPRQHCVGFLDAPPLALAVTTQLLQRVGQALVSSLGASGVVVLNASGAHSGQTVPHLHFHVVPCWPDDNAMFWPEDRSSHRVAEPVHDIIAEALKR